MSITATRPEVAEEPEPQPAAGRPAILQWLTSVDHKPIGIAYLYTALLFSVAAAVAGIGQRLELSGSGLQLLPRANDLRFVTLFVSSIFFLVMAPAFTGFATYLVPLQIGATRLAFPRLHGLAYWLFLGGGLMVLVSYVVGGSPFAAESLLVRPAAAQAGRASDLWLLGMGAVNVAALLAAAGLIATLVTMRPPGLTVDRLPAFSWATLVSSTLVVLATPVFVAGLVLHYVNLHHGGRLFAGGRAPGVLWQHVLWLYGRPELLALLIMGAGVICEVVPVFARRRLPTHRPVLALLGAVGALAFLIWAYSTSGAGAPLAPTFSPAAVLPFLPLGALILVWLATLALGRPRPSAALALATGFVVCFAVAALGLLSALVVHVRQATAWAEGHTGLLLVALPLFALSAAGFYWGPKLWGRHLNEGLGYLQFLLMLGGFLIAFVPSYLGLRDFPRYSGATSGAFTAWNRLAALGVLLLLLALIVFVANLASSVWARRGREAAADPWEGATLEWLAPSPPPPHNFAPDALPEIRSEQPVLDLRAASPEGAA